MPPFTGVKINALPARIVSIINIQLLTNHLDTVKSNLN